MRTINEGIFSEEEIEKLEVGSRKDQTIRFDNQMHFAKKTQGIKSLNFISIAEEEIWVGHISTSAGFCFLNTVNPFVLPGWFVT